MTGELIPTAFDVLRDHVSGGPSVLTAAKAAAKVWNYYARAREAEGLQQLLEYLSARVGARSGGGRA